MTGAFGIVCIFVGLLSILANLYALTVAQGAYEFSRTPSVAGGPAIPIAPVPGSTPSAALDANLAVRIAKAANETAGWKFTPAEVDTIQSQLQTDKIGFARAHDESAVVAAFVNSVGNAVVTFDTARTLAISPNGQVVAVFSPTLPGGGVKVSLAMILIEALTAAGLLALGVFLILRGYRDAGRCLPRPGNVAHLHRSENSACHCRRDFDCRLELSNRRRKYSWRSRVDGADCSSGNSAARNRAGLSDSRADVSGDGSLANAALKKILTQRRRGAEDKKCSFATDLKADEHG